MKPSYRIALTILLLHIKKFFHIFIVTFQIFSKDVRVSGDFEPSTKILQVSCVFTDHFRFILYFLLKICIVNGIFEMSIKNTFSHAFHQIF